MTSNSDPPPDVFALGLEIDQLLVRPEVLMERIRET